MNRFQLEHSKMDKLDFNIHDYTFLNLKVNYKKKSVQIEIQPPHTDAKKERIIFSNMIGLEMVSCDFWGSSPHILDLETLPSSKQKLIKSLFQEKSDNGYTFSRLSNESKFIEIVITFTSGDRLTIACEHVSWETREQESPGGGSVCSSVSSKTNPIDPD